MQTRLSAMIYVLAGVGQGAQIQAGGQPCRGFIAIANEVLSEVNLCADWCKNGINCKDLQ